MGEAPDTLIAPCSSVRLSRGCSYYYDYDL